MAVFKCKMCGGDLEVVEGNTTCECEYCGTLQTLPSLDNEKKLNLFNRANRLRFNNEFDKAAAVYESIVAEFPEEAEAYWGLCLCKYGIEYVDDPTTAKKIPTCHRTSYDSIFNDSNFEMALEYADMVAQRVYREEAKEIDRLQQSILEIAKNEKPYDIFICYKETAEDGQRTKDSVLAQDMYDALTAKGYKVFFSRITLEDKLGQEYEPYIFSALNSAKIMLAVGTKYEYYNAVWVKNEWSRFLDMMNKDKSKVLIPCYADIDAYDMPQEFRNLQGQDMGKVGFMQDLVRGIEKIIPLGKTEQLQQPVIQQVIAGTTTNTENLLKRGNLALEDQKWDEADKFFDRVLDENAEEARAYLGKLMAELKVSSESALGEVCQSFDENPSFKKICRFANDDLKERITNYCTQANYKYACLLLENAQTTDEFNKTKEIFNKYPGYKDSKIKVDEFIRKSEERLNISKMHRLHSISSSGEHIVGLRNDGTVVAIGSDIDKRFGDYWEWTNIVSISTGMHHIVGLKANGNVIADGENIDGLCNVCSWRKIVSVSSGSYHIVGLTEKGTVVAVGNNKNGQCDVSKWSNIIAISTGLYHTVGLKRNGTVVAVGDNKFGECDVSSWQDMVSVCAGGFATIGIKSDGTIVVAGLNEYQQDLLKWNNISQVAIERSFVIGLKSNGMLISVGANDHGQCNVQNYCNIAEIAVGEYHTVCVKSDGSVIDIGCRKNGSKYSFGYSFSNLKVGKTLLTKTDDNPKLASSNNSVVNFINSNPKVSSSESTTTSTSSGGCYIATCVYGSYDCPQVWTLRRFRDYTLANTWYGRAFVHIYYAVSPTLVKWFGHTEWFKKFWKSKLDRMVSDLQKNGVGNTAYQDRKW